MVGWCPLVRTQDWYVALAEVCTLLSSILVFIQSVVYIHICYAGMYRFVIEQRCTQNTKANLAYEDIKPKCYITVALASNSSKHR